MSMIEIVILAWAIVSMIASLASLYFVHQWKNDVARKHSVMEAMNLRIKGNVDELHMKLLELVDGMCEMKNKLYGAGIETLKVRSEDHDRAIESIRKDLLDLQVLSGTLPSRAGTMLQELENTLDELKKLQSSYLEIKAVNDRTKEQVEKLAEAYSSLHFTGKELEELRDEIEDLSRKTS